MELSHRLLRSVGASTVSQFWRVGVTFAIHLLLRFLRWQCYLVRLGCRVPWGPSLTCYLAGFALTTTPGKVGETLRLAYLTDYDVDYPASLSAFFAEVTCVCRRPICGRPSSAGGKAAARFSATCLVAWPAATILAITLPVSSINGYFTGVPSRTY